MSTYVIPSINVGVWWLEKVRDLVRSQQNPEDLKRLMIMVDLWLRDRDLDIHMGVVQRPEHQLPNLSVGGSSPSAHAVKETV